MTRREARELAAQAWCHPMCGNTVMDVDLAEAFAEILEREVNRTAGADEPVVLTFQKEHAPNCDGKCGSDAWGIRTCQPFCD